MYTRYNGKLDSNILVLNTLISKIVVVLLVVVVVVLLPGP
jgi:hypothetical protein